MRPLVGNSLMPWNETAFGEQYHEMKSVFLHCFILLYKADSICFDISCYGAQHLDLMVVLLRMLIQLWQWQVLLLLMGNLRYSTLCMIFICINAKDVIIVTCIQGFILLCSLLCWFGYISSCHYYFDPYSSGLLHSYPSIASLSVR